MKKLLVWILIICVLTTALSSCATQSADQKNSFRYEDYIGTWHYIDSDIADGAHTWSLAVHEADQRSITFSLHFGKVKSYSYITAVMESGCAQFKTSGAGDVSAMISGVIALEADTIVVSIEESINPNIEIGSLDYAKDTGKQQSRYERFCAVQLGMTMPEVEKTYGRRLEHFQKEGGGDYGSVLYRCEYDDNATNRIIKYGPYITFTFLGGALTEKSQNSLAKPLLSNPFSISYITYEQIITGMSYDEVSELVGGKGIPDWEYYQEDLIKKKYYILVEDRWVYLIFNNDILAEKGQSEA